MKNILHLLLLIITLNTNAHDGVVNLNTAKPEAGKEIRFTYTGKLAKEGTRIRLIYSCDGSYRTPQMAIPIKIIDNKIVGSFILPDSAAFFTLKISNKAEIDNNAGNGYGFNVYQNRVPKKGTFFAQANSIFYNKFHFNGNIDTDKANALIEKEFALNPDMKLKAGRSYVYVLSLIPSRKVEAVALAKQYFEEILKTGLHEKDTFWYTNIIADGKRKVSDSLKSLVENKYPTGFSAFRRKLNLINSYATSKPDTAFIIYNNILRDFPDLNLEQRTNLKIGILSAYAAKEDYASLEKEMSSFITENRWNIDLVTFADACNEIAWNMYEAEKDLKEAKKIAEKSIMAYQLYDSTTVYYGAALDTYAAILAKTGDKKGAIINQKKAVSLNDNLDLEYNESLIKYLFDDRQFAETKTKAEEFIAQNLSTVKIDSLYRLAYMASGGSEEGFEEDYSNLIEKNEALYIKVLQEKMIEKDAPELILKDLNGTPVKLSDYHNKIVILDFWATWCAPCVGSFPAMKKAMTELQDKNVQFLFINTLENENLDNWDKKNAAIKKTLKNKNVSDFRVLIDEEKDLNYVARSAYNVSSIPAKFIIDKNGKIRYKSTGFSTDERLVRELTTVVKMIDE